MSSLVAEFFANWSKTPKMHAFWIFTGIWVILCILHTDRPNLEPNCRDRQTDKTLQIVKKKVENRCQRSGDDREGRQMDGNTQRSDKDGKHRRDHRWNRSRQSRTQVGGRRIPKGKKRRRDNRKLTHNKQQQHRTDPSTRFHFSCFLEFNSDIPSCCWFLICPSPSPRPPAVSLLLRQP